MSGRARARATWSEDPEPGAILEKTCRDCDEPILLVYTTAGRWMPCTLGRIKVDLFAPVELVGLVTEDGQMVNGMLRLAVPQRAEGWRFHFQTCVDRKEAR